ncbi:TAP-like protein-domain-containing protein [Aspergillus spinulosporus]
MAKAVTLAAVLFCSGVQTASIPRSSLGPVLSELFMRQVEVPLDYGEPSRGVTAIAFLKLSATNATSNTRSFPINQGGPGGSGIESVFSQGAALAGILQGRHNIVGFDPRGVGRSGPSVDCWPGNPEGRAQFEKLYYPEIYNASSTSAGRQSAAAEIFGHACSSTVGGSNGSAAFVSTPAVAHDMLSFVEAEQKQRLAENESYNEQAMRWYYGVSYGTVLGATFEHLFPDKVERMVLDGVVDAEDYYSLGWRSNLYDADKALESFIQSCFQAGESCAFWGPSVQNIRSRLDALRQDLKYNPISIAPSVTTCPLPMLATYSDLKQLIFQAMYVPTERFPNLAAILAGLEQGNTTVYAIAVTGGTIPANPCNYALSTATTDVDTLIKCVDGAGERQFRDISQFEDYADVLTSQSEAFEVSPPESGKPKGSILDSRHTASPILFVTTELDPVAPKRGAYKMSSVFPGSAVLTQHSVGHTAFLNPSSCFAQRARNYLLSGKLPPPNSTCQADAEPFR